MGEIEDYTRLLTVTKCKNLGGEVIAVLIWVIEQNFWFRRENWCKISWCGAQYLEILQTPWDHSKHKKKPIKYLQEDYQMFGGLMN
jgi:hypothetical protein